MYNNNQTFNPLKNEENKSIYNTLNYESNSNSLMNSSIFEKINRIEFPFSNIMEQGILNTNLSKGNV